jgi:ATP-dependent Lhr-like helicase
VESLRAARDRADGSLFTIAAADPLNLAGIVLPGERVPAMPGRTVQYCNGVVVQAEGASAEVIEMPAEIVQEAPRRELFQ